jgi:hypothetical protein
MTRITLNRETRWVRFFSAQVTAMLIHKVMRRFGFRPYIRRFAMSAGCCVVPDTLKSVGVEMSDMIERIEDVSCQLSACQERQALGGPDSFMEPLFALNEQLACSGWVKPVPESGRLSGSGIRNRLFVGPAGSRGANNGRVDHNSECGG